MTTHPVNVTASERRRSMRATASRKSTSATITSGTGAAARRSAKKGRTPKRPPGHVLGGCGGGIPCGSPEQSDRAEPPGWRRPRWSRRVPSRSRRTHARREIEDSGHIGGRAARARARVRFHRTCRRRRERRAPSHRIRIGHCVGPSSRMSASAPRRIDQASRSIPPSAIAAIPPRSSPLSPWFSRDISAGHFQMRPRYQLMSSAP